MSSTVLNRCVVIASLALVASWPGMVSAAKAETGASVVVRLYKDFAWQAIGGSDLFGSDISHQSKPILEKYFDSPLALLLVQDAACQVKSQGICRLDFDLLFDSQDPRVTDLGVESLAPGKVAVEFKDPVSEVKTKLEFAVAMVAGKWKITDIIYRKTGTSLKTALSRKFP